jgi:hypothetical protein
MVTETEKILFRSGIREDRFCLTGFMHVQYGVPLPPPGLIDLFLKELTCHLT